MNEKINLVMESEIKRVFPITQYTSGVVLDTYLDDYTIPENATVYFSAKTESGKQFKYECEYKDNMVTVPVSLQTTSELGTSECIIQIDANGDNVVGTVSETYSVPKATTVNLLSDYDFVKGRRYDFTFKITPNDLPEDVAIIVGGIIVRIADSDDNAISTVITKNNFSLPGVLTGSYTPAQNYYGAFAQIVILGGRPTNSVEMGMKAYESEETPVAYTYKFDLNIVDHSLTDAEIDQSQEYAELKEYIEGTEYIIRSANRQEAIRVENEEERVANENERAQAEAQRIANEDARIEAENLRQKAESERNAAETNRVNSEADRNTAEGTRSANETSRGNAQDNRRTTYNGWSDTITNCENAIAEMQGKSFNYVPLNSNTLTRGGCTMTYDASQGGLILSWGG